MGGSGPVVGACCDEMASHTLSLTAQSERICPHVPYMTVYLSSFSAWTKKDFLTSSEGRAAFSEGGKGESYEWLD